MKKRDKIIAVLLAGMLPVSSVLAFDKVKDGDTNLQINEQYAEETEVYPIEGIKDGEEVPAELLAEVSPPDTRKAKRFIIKYKDNKNKVNSEKIRTDLSPQYDVKNVKEFKLKKSSKFMFFSSEKEEQLHVVEVNEEVDINEFTDDIETEFDVEYVQPDYKIDLSSLDNTIIGEIKSHSDMEEDNITSDSENIDISFSDALNKEQAGTEDNTEISTNEDAVEDNITSEDGSDETTDYGQNDAESTDETDVGTENEISADMETDKQIETTPEAAETVETTEPVKNNEPSETELTESEDDTNIVALIDTGVDIYNEALVGRIYNNDAEKGNDEDGNGFTGDVNGWDFYNDIPEVYNAELGMDQAHGTHIAGIIAETATDAKILPLKVFENGVAYTSDIIEAIQYAEMMGANVVNCSWGCTEENSALKEAMESSSMTFVCASGNNRLDLSETPIYPACFDLDNVISVTSVNDDGGLSYFSNYGNVDIAAPGRDIEGIFPGNTTGTLTGTSISAAMVTGAVAAVYTNNDETKVRLFNTSDKLLNLQNYVENGRRLNYDCMISNTANTEVVDLNPAEDFNTDGYSRTPAESWDLFSALNNVAVAAGRNHLVVLKEDGTVWTWGKNNYGQLGIGSYTISEIPQQVQTISNIVEIDAGENHTIARTESGDVYTWGSNSDGCLGIGSAARSNVPVKMLSGTDAIAIGATSNVSYVIKEGNILYACGSNGYGQIGDGTTTSRNTLVKVNVPESIVSVTGGGGASFAISQNGELYSWGHNGYGRLGNGTTTDCYTPQKIIESGVVDVSMGFFTAMAVKSDGTVFKWGYGATSSPRQVTGLSGIKKILSGRQSEFALGNDNTLKSKGMNTSGVLGVGDVKWHNNWCVVEGSFLDLDVDEFRAIALGTDGYVYVWGDINNETGEYSTSPEKLTGRVNDFSGESFAEAESVNLGTTYGRITAESRKDYYKFVPSGSYNYSIYSISNIDLVCKIYTKNDSGTYTLKYSNDDAYGSMGGNNRDFCVTKDLVAGTEYYIYVYPYSGSSTGDYELHIITASTENKYTYSSSAGDKNSVYINVNNIDSFENKVFKVIYDEAQLLLTDACMFSKEPETVAKEIPYTGIRILSVNNGEIVFTVNQSVPTGKKISGTINVLQFKALVDGEKSIRYEVNATE